MSRNEVEATLAAIMTEDRAALLERWAELFGSDPPKGMHATMLRRVIAHEVQLRAFGGLSRETRARLDRLVRDLSGARSFAPSKSAIAPGTRFVREWNGRTHVVEAIEGGFLWRGATYTSLSSVARAITGARWSGQRFFGLKAKRS